MNKLIEVIENQNWVFVVFFAVWPCICFSIHPVNAPEVHHYEMSLPKQMATTRFTKL